MCLPCVLCSVFGAWMGWHLGSLIRPFAAFDVCKEMSCDQTAAKKLHGWLGRVDKLVGRKAAQQATWLHGHHVCMCAFAQGLQTEWVEEAEEEQPRQASEAHESDQENTAPPPRALDEQVSKTSVSTSPSDIERRVGPHLPPCPRALMKAVNHL